MYTDIKDIHEIVKALRGTFQKGITRNDIAYRRQQLLNFSRMIQERQLEIIEAVHKDLCKHKVETIISEIYPVLGEIEFMLKNLDSFSKTDFVKPYYLLNATTKCAIRKEPKGVVLIIGPWNYPLQLSLLPMVGAIAAGNCIILKPSEVACHTSKLIGEMIPEYLDSNAYAVVQGGVAETTALLEQKFDHIFYTGSGSVGKLVMAAASKHLTSVTLELGGKSPVIIAPDTNIKMAASRVMWGKLFNAGQICISPDYVLIQKDQLTEFAHHCKESIKTMFSDNPKTSDSYCRIISQRRFDALQKLIESVDSSQIITGGEMDKDELYISPTVVNLPQGDDHPLMKEEIFGPILPIIPVENIDQAIEFVNSKDSPLALYIFTDNSNIREKILNNTQSGGALINDVLLHVQDIALPFGGAGSSGMGSYHGKKSFDVFTHERSTMIQTSRLETVMAARYPPYNDGKLSVFTLLTIGLPAGISNKIKFLYEVISSTKQVFSSTAEKSNPTKKKD